MKHLIIALLSTLSVAYADPSIDGREEAATVCGKAAFSADRTECIRIVGQAFYFELNAISVCDKISFSSGYPRCIEAIANKTFLQAELNTCGGASFDSGKVSCLTAAGRGLTGPVYDPRPHADRYILLILTTVERDLKAGRIADALVGVGRLIRYIKGEQPL